MSGSWSHPDLQRFLSKQAATSSLASPTSAQHSGAVALAAASCAASTSMAMMAGGKRERVEDKEAEQQGELPHKPTIAPRQTASSAVATKDSSLDQWESKLLQSVRTQEAVMSATRSEIADLKAKLEALEATIVNKEANYRQRSDVVHILSAQRAEREEMGSQTHTKADLQALLSKMVISMTTCGDVATPPQLSSPTSDDGSMFPLDSPTSEEGAAESGRSGLTSRVFTEIDSFGDDVVSAPQYEFIRHASTIVQGLYIPHNTYHSVVNALNDRQHDRDAEELPVGVATSPRVLQWDSIYEHTCGFLQAIAPRLSLVMSPACAGRASLRGGGKSRSGTAWLASIAQLVDLCCPTSAPSSSSATKMTDMSVASADALQCSVLIVPDFIRAQEGERCVGSLLQDDGNSLFGEHCGDARCPYQHTNQALFVVSCIRDSLKALDSSMCRGGQRNRIFEAFRLHCGYGCDALEAAITAAHDDIDQGGLVVDDLEIAKRASAIAAKLLVLEQCAVWYHAYIIQIYLQDFVFAVVGPELATKRGEAGSSTTDLIAQLRRVVASTSQPSQVNLPSSGNPPLQDYLDVDTYMLSQLQLMPFEQHQSGAPGSPGSCDLLAIFADGTVDGGLAATSLSAALYPLLYSTTTPLLKPIVHLLQQSQVHARFAAQFAALWALSQLGSTTLDGIPHSGPLLKALEAKLGTVDRCEEGGAGTCASSLKSRVLEYALRLCASYLSNDASNREVAWAGLIVATHRISVFQEDCSLSADLHDQFTNVVREQRGVINSASLIKQAREDYSDTAAIKTISIASLTQALLRPPTTTAPALPPRSVTEGRRGVTPLLAAVITSAADRCPGCVTFRNLRLNALLEEVASRLRQDDITREALEATARELVDNADSAIGGFVDVFGGGNCREEDLTAQVAEVLIMTVGLLFRCLCRLVPAQDTAMSAAVYVCLVGPALGGDQARTILGRDSDAADLLHSLHIEPLGVVPVLMAARLSLLLVASSALCTGGTAAQMAPLYRLLAESDISEETNDLLDLSRQVSRGAPLFERGGAPTTNETSKAVLTYVVNAAEHLVQLCGVEAGLLPDRGPLIPSPPPIGNHQLRSVIGDALLLRAIHDCEMECQCSLSCLPPGMPVSLAALQLTLLRRRTAHLKCNPTDFSNALGAFFDGSACTDANAAYACQIAVFKWFTDGVIPSGPTSISYAGLITSIVGGGLDGKGSPSHRNPEKHIPTLSAAFMVPMLRQHAFPSGWSAGGNPEGALVVCLKIFRTFCTKVCSYDIGLTGVLAGSPRGRAVRNAVDTRVVLKVRDEELMYDLEQCIGLSNLILEIARRVPRVQLALRLWDWSMLETLACEEATSTSGPLTDIALAPTSMFVSHLHAVFEKERSPLLGGPSVFMAQVGAAPSSGGFELTKQKPSVDDVRRYCVLGATPQTNTESAAGVARGPCLLESYTQLLLSKVLQAVSAAGLVSI